MPLNDAAARIERLSMAYARFAEREAHGRSPCYEALAQGIAADQEVLAFLLTLPLEKRQPNLLLAAMRHRHGTMLDFGHFRRALLADPDAVREIMLAHSTQTNEPARCAVLLPVLARLPQPLALIEVGASAGLCLLPDFYSYDYGQTILRPAVVAADPPVFACRVTETTPLPARMPQIVWRAGLDLNPVDPTNTSQAKWLEALVWPEQTHRLANLRAALMVAAMHRPRVVKGDLLGEALDRLCREAPLTGTLVIYHTAVLPYVVDPETRQAFARRVVGLCDYWVSNEAPNLLPGIARRAPARGGLGQFLLSVNGRPVAWSDPHGASLEWIAADWDGR